jgi:hypothetical protein
MVNNLLPADISSIPIEESKFNTLVLRAWGTVTKCARGRVIQSLYEETRSISMPPRDTSARDLPGPDDARPYLGRHLF